MNSTNLKSHTFNGKYYPKFKLTGTGSHKRIRQKLRPDLALSMETFKGLVWGQAANMLQGRAVFREDLVSRAAEQYKVWSFYQFDQTKDRYGN